VDTTGTSNEQNDMTATEVKDAPSRRRISSYDVTSGLVMLPKVSLINVFPVSRDVSI